MDFPCKELVREGNTTLNVNDIILSQVESGLVAVGQLPALCWPCTIKHPMLAPNVSLCL